MNIRAIRVLLATTALAALAACGGIDGDLRGKGALDTSSAVTQATTDRPAPDSRGVISYPNYQVAVARNGDTLASLAQRVGLSEDELARFNGMPVGSGLRANEVVALPRRVAEPLGGPIVSGNAITPGGAIDVTTIGAAIDRSQGSVITPANPQPAAQVGGEPVRHQVKRGETAYSISRLYNVSVRSLAEWNGLGPDLVVREGGFLLIPVADRAAPVRALPETDPGEGTIAPLPPSSANPLPEADEQPATTASTAANTPPSPDLAADRTSQAKLLMPVQGSIIRAYEKKKNDGIDIGVAAGTAVKAAADGKVAAITIDTDQVPIVVIRHANNLLTVYAGIEGVTVKKGDTITRGQTIGKVRAGSPSFLHFEVREGFESVDPVPFL
jgi:murein DD-endopeptidase MepM/ murein hydrolase activator NlpD